MFTYQWLMILFIYWQESEEVLSPLARIIPMRSVLLPCTSLQLKVWPRILELWDVCFLHVQPACGHWRIHSLALQFLVFSQSFVDLQVCSGPLSCTRVQLCFKLVLFFFWGGDVVVYRCSPMFLKSPLIHSSIRYGLYAAHLSGPATKCPHAMTHHLIRPKDIIPEVLVQESWSGWPSCFCFSVTPPMRYSLSGYTEMHSHSNSTAGTCCGFPDDIWEILESSSNIFLLLETTGVDG